MRPLHFPVELRRPSFEVDVPDPFIGEVPVKLRLELVSPVGPHRMNPKRALRDHVIEETHGVLLSVARVHLEGPDTGGIVDGRVLIAPRRPATWADQLQERDIDLDVMAGDLFGVSMRVHDTSSDATRQAIQAVSAQDAVDGRVGNGDAVRALELPADADGAKVISAAEMKDRLDDVRGCAEPRVVRARFLIDQARVTIRLLGLLPHVKP